MEWGGGWSGEEGGVGRGDSEKRWKRRSEEVEIKWEE